MYGCENTENYNLKNSKIRPAASRNDNLQVHALYIKSLLLGRILYLQHVLRHLKITSDSCFPDTFNIKSA